MSAPYTNPHPIIRGEGVPSARFIDEDFEHVGMLSSAHERFAHVAVCVILTMIAWCICKFLAAPQHICVLVPFICGGIVTQYMLRLRKNKS
jgi:hypothetical protein